MPEEDLHARGRSGCILSAAIYRALEVANERFILGAEVLQLIPLA
jgi:hypothetical protein